MNVKEMKVEPVEKRVSIESQSLEVELKRLEGLLGLSLDLKVVWKPSKDGVLSGEVKNNTIFVYEMSEEKAVNTLQHEYIDYCLSQAIEPYKEITNMLIRIINRECYRKKERIVEALVKLLNRDCPHSQYINLK